MRAIDTNVLLRLMISDDGAQTASAEQFVRDGAWVSTVVLVEAIWVLNSKYGTSLREQAEIVQLLLDNPRILLEQSEAVREALELFRNRPSIGFSDCMVLALARMGGHLPLGTFDRRLGSVDGAQRI